MPGAVHTAEEEREWLALAIADGLPIDWSLVAERALLAPGELSALRALATLRSPTPTPFGLSPGTLVGDFRLLAPVGEGGMGQVWEAEQLSLGRRVAMKFVRPERVTEKQLELFAREARAGGRLSHPGLVAVHGHGKAGDLAWIAMELVRGGRTVRTLLDERQRNVPEQHDREVAELVARVAEAMQTAHEAGVIHRDLKPENLLLDPQGLPRVTDFGLARIESETALSTSGLVLGTCFYMSPEHASGRRSAVDARTDIFSLGVVLYELLALRRPFEGDTLDQVVDKIRRLPPADPRTIRSKVPRDLAVIASRALEKDPRRRFQSMAEFAADLRRFLADSPIHSRPASHLYRATKWVQRNPALGTAATVAATSFVAISILLAENLSTNKALAEERNQLEQANKALVTKTREAETSALLAIEQSRLAHQRLESVLRLSALQRHDELVAEADQLWPVTSRSIDRFSRWIDEARKLAGSLPEYLRELEEIRARAVPLSPEELQLEVERHPRFAELQRERRRLASLQRVAEAAASGVARPEEPPPQGARFPTDAEECRRLAWTLVDPDRTDWGAEDLGLSLARHALELADDAQRADARITLAWALLSLGRFEEAVEQGELALDEAPRESREAFESRVEALLVAAESHQDEEGVRRDQAELERTKQRIAVLENEVSPRDRRRFSTQEDGWLHDELERLVSGLQTLIDPRTGLCSKGFSSEHGWGMEKRLELAKQMDQLCLSGPAARAAWAEATRSIASESECPLYRGLRLEPQRGLLPIGRDPRSGLWEFVDLQTGVAPVRNAQGDLVPDEAMGLVFVLLPGGNTWIGSQGNDPRGRHFYRESAPEEGPVHEVVLSPFFLSKYEMTQGQWQRFTGSNPSYVTAAVWRNQQSRVGTWTPLLPVEQVSWSLCARTVQRLGMSLPSEAQWEYAARGGSDTPWWCGEDPGSIRLAGNLADLYAHDHGGSSWAGHEPWDDGHSGTAPVGSFLPNPFGLHDVIGNVWEWCRDTYQLPFYRASPRFDPVSEQPDPHANRVWRGGGANERSAEARSGHRSGLTPDAALWVLGLRPARELERTGPERRLATR